MRINRSITSAVAVAGLATAPAAAADDDAAKTGLAAGLGFTAASGKTTLGAGAGTIETQLLVSEPLLKAGQTIRTLLGAAPDGRPYLILAKGDAVDFTMALWLGERMRQLEQRTTDLVGSGAACRKAQIVVETTTTTAATSRSLLLGKSVNADSPSTTTKKLSFAPTDIAAALQTDISIAQISAPAEDRELIEAILIGGAREHGWRDASTIVDSAVPVGKTAGSAAGNRAQFRSLLSPGAADPGQNPALLSLARLQRWTDLNRHCDSDDFKALVGTIDSFVAGVTASDKGTPAIVAAAELAPEGLDKLPIVVRVAIDAVGGTSITRSNIWFNIGFPGAAQMTGGLKVSFSTWDPRSGAPGIAGVVRCATAPISYRNVRKMLVTAVANTSEGQSLLNAQDRLTTCAVRTS